MTDKEFDDYWYRWHLQQEDLYESGRIEDDRRGIYDYCLATFREHQNFFDTVIEVGVGNAFLLNRLYQENPRLSCYGLDRNLPILKRNSRKFPHLKFVHGDAVEVLEGIRTSKGVFLFALVTLEYLAPHELELFFAAVRKNFSRGIFLFSGVSGPEELFADKDCFLINDDPFVTKYGHNYQKYIARYKFPRLDGMIFHCLDEQGKKSDIYIYKLGLGRK